MAANSRGSISSPPAEVDEWGNARPFLSSFFPLPCWIAPAPRRSLYLLSRDFERQRAQVMSDRWRTTETDDAARAKVLADAVAAGEDAGPGDSAPASSATPTGGGLAFARIAEEIGMEMLRRSMRNTGADRRGVTASLMVLAAEQTSGWPRPPTRRGADQRRAQAHLGDAHNVSGASPRRWCSEPPDGAGMVVSASAMVARPEYDGMHETKAG